MIGMSDEALVAAPATAARAAAARDWSAIAGKSRKQDNKGTAQLPIGVAHKTWRLTYATGFEAEEGYTAGNRLSGQGGWLAGTQGSSVSSSSPIGGLASLEARSTAIAGATIVGQKGTHLGDATTKDSCSFVPLAGRDGSFGMERTWVLTVYPSGTVTADPGPAGAESVVASVTNGTTYRLEAEVLPGLTWIARLDGNQVGAVNGTLASYPSNSIRFNVSGSNSAARIDDVRCEMAV